MYHNHIHCAENTLRISASYRNCFHGALQFNELFRHTRFTVVDEISEDILRRFEVDAKSFTQLLQVQPAAGQQPRSQRPDAPCD